jgi:pimeloyl-ACP methyl ester carboxylesterase
LLQNTNAKPCADFCGKHHSQIRHAETGLAYPAWQSWLREHLPPTLVVWGRYDPSFEVAAAHAYIRDVPDAEVHLLDAGHFALDEAADEIARLTRSFLERLA